MNTKWSDVKAVLDDPAVPPGEKTVLISSWLKTHPAPPPWMADQEPEEIKQKRQEAQKYAEAFNANPFVATDDVDKVYESAKKAGDQAGYNRREESKAVGEGNTKLDGAKAPSADGGGTETSDELFDAAAPALKVFETFGSLLAKLPEDCRGNTRALDFAKDIQKPFDEQRGISFRNFVDDAAHFKTGSTTVERTVQDTDSQLNGLYRTWTGDGADASSDHYNEKILPKANKLAQTLSMASEATLSTTTTVFELCKGKADAIIEMHTNLVGRADYPMAQKVIAIATGEKSGKEDLAAIAGWMDVNFGSNLVQSLNNDGCCDDDEFKKAGQNLAKQWIQNQFKPDMWDRLYQGFVKTCEDTKEFVDQAYDELDKMMGKVKNEFEGAAQPPGSGAGGPGGGGTGGGPGTGGPEIPDGNSGVPGGNSGVPGSGSGTPGGGSGGSGSGSGGGSGTGGSGGTGSAGGTDPAGERPPPPIPDVSIPPAGSGAGSSGGSGTGGPGSGPGSPGDDTAPSGSVPPPPPSSSGNDQQAAAEEAKRQAAAAAEEAKKQAAEDAKKQAADALGKLGDAPLGGGTGGDTRSDAAEGKEAAEKAAEEAKKQASDALGKIGDELPGEGGDKLTGDKPGEDGEKSEDGERDVLKVKQGDKTFEMCEPDKDGEMDIKVGDGSGPAKEFKLDWSGDGPDSGLGSAPGPDDGKPDKDGVHRPGPDGKIHIQDGDLKITAERPDGPDGPTVVTVDDGTGKPTSYTLGEEKSRDENSREEGAREKESREDKPALKPTPFSGTGEHEPRPGPTPLGGSGGGDGGGAGGGGGGSASAPRFDDATPATGQPSSLSEGVHTGAGTHQQQPAPAAVASAAMAGGTSGQPPVGAMPPMGGMAAGGAGGAGGANGGDQERANRAYRIEGEVFDQITAPTGRITGSLLDDEEPPATRKR